MPDDQCVYAVLCWWSLWESGSALTPMRKHKRSACSVARICADLIGNLDQCWSSTDFRSMLIPVWIQIFIDHSVDRKLCRLLWESGHVYADTIVESGSLLITMWIRISMDNYVISDTVHENALYQKKTYYYYKAVLSGFFCALTRKWKSLKMLHSVCSLEVKNLFRFVFSLHYTSHLPLSFWELWYTHRNDIKFDHE